MRPVRSTPGVCQFPSPIELSRGIWKLKSSHWDRTELFVDAHLHWLSLPAVGRLRPEQELATCIAPETAACTLKSSAEVVRHHRLHRKAVGA